MPNAWTMLTRRVCPPDLMLTLVRAMAAVAGTPPKKGMSMLPTPCAINSWLACRRIPVMFEATAPHSRDSTAPRAVMVNAGASRSGRFAQGRLARLRRWSRNRVWGMAPIIGVDQPRLQFRAVARMMPNSEAGKRALHLDGHSSMAAITTAPSRTACPSGTNPPLK